MTFNLPSPTPPAPGLVTLRVKVPCRLPLETKSPDSRYEEHDDADNKRRARQRNHQGDDNPDDQSDGETHPQQAPKGANVARVKISLQTMIGVHDISVSTPSLRSP